MGRIEYNMNKQENLNLDESSKKVMELLEDAIKVLKIEKRRIKIDYNQYTKVGGGKKVG